MSHVPEGPFKWIAHVIDLFSKFNIFWRMTNKCAIEVVKGLKRFQNIASF